jgi:spore coat polysaccharide biosynthesis protein SpsF
MKRTVALIQARMSSNRFPGKVLQDLGGVPMIVFMVRRARLARSLDEVVVATSVDSSDDPLGAVLEEHGIPAFRGDLHDVLGRYKQAADHFNASEVVRLTGDCPLVDPTIVDAVTHARAETRSDYSSNVDPPTFPDGFDVECFSIETLNRAVAAATATPEREHVTLWMRSERSSVRRTNVRTVADLSHLRLTVDYPDDLAAVRRIVTGCKSTGGVPDLFDILRYLAKHPEISQLNSHPRRERLTRTLAAGS